MEIWKKLKGFDCDYEISNYGRIKNAKTQRILKLIQESSSDSYIRVRCNLRKNGTTSKPTVARLVLQTFNPINSQENYHVDHIDFNSTNNKLNNLKWSTPEENSSNRRTIKYYDEQLKLRDRIIAKLIKAYL